MGVVLWAYLFTFMLLIGSASHWWAPGIDIYALLWWQSSTKNMDQVFILMNSRCSICFSWAAEWNWFWIRSECSVLSELFNWAFRPCAFLRKSLCVCVTIGTYVYICNSLVQDIYREKKREECSVGTYLCPTSVGSHIKEHSMKVVRLNFL